MTERRKPDLNEHELNRVIDRALGQSNPIGHQESDDPRVNEVERDAALLDIAVALSHPVDMPAGLADRLKAQIPDSSDQQSSSTENQRKEHQEAPYTIAQESPADASAWRWVPWMVAAAALLIATVSVLVPRSIPNAPDLKVQRQALIDGTPAGMLIQWDWISTDDAAVVGDVIGDVVWSDAENRGYMRISGLAVNDPSLDQYQLWIFDATRPSGDLPQFGEGLLSQRPVDGGVFDVHADGEVIIEIDAKLVVEQAAAFAITVEPPGGVVVSDRSRVPLLALAP